MSVLSWEEDINRDSPYKVSVFTDTYALKFFIMEIS